MIRINENYAKLEASYLFSDIARRVNAFQAANPDRRIIRMGIGDVTEPLPPACIAALHAAVDEMAKRETFRGYGPEQGYAFLRDLIAKHDFQARGCAIEADEIFVSDGAKCDSGNIQELFATDVRIGIPDPVYPVYVDTNVMAGRTGRAEGGRYGGLVYLDGNEANGYLPPPPAEALDLVYLCSPNNPTGAVATKAQLQAWVDYARANQTLILFDAAYEAFVRDPALPRSIYEIEGAREVAIELRSFSKTAGFTGTRCAFAVVPKSLMAYTADGKPQSVHALWNRRHTTKFNGVSYPVQRAAAAVYTPEGQQQTQGLVEFYLGNAKIIRAALTKLGLSCTGGENAPYVWVRTGRDSWQFFDELLNKAGVVCTPGVGFGQCGQGCVRFSAFNSRANVEEGMERVRAALA